MVAVFEVPGEPRAKGRPRFNRNTGRVFADSETVAYEKKIAAYYNQQLQGYKWPDNAFIAVDVVAHYPIPKTATKAAAAAMAAGEVLPSRKPDIDNVLKAVLDALNGVAYKDDSRVVSVSAKKIYSHTPKLVIEMREGE